MTATMNDTQKLTANTIRGLAMDAVQKANSGHPGMPMGMADVATVLWTQHLRYSVADPHWAGRDRFVLSAGHGSMLLYSLLHLAGFPVSLDDLKNFRQLHSNTPGHPEFGDTVGVEITTGPLGSGFGSGVGMALGAKLEAARFQNPHYENRVVGIVSDGDLMEGVANEAASIAGHLGLDNLVYFYDDNRITIDGETDLTFSEDVPARFAALGWRVLSTDGHDYEQIHAVMEEAFTPGDRPTLVVCKTHIAFGSPHKQDTSASHGAPLGEEEIAATKAALGMPGKSFYVPDEAYQLFAAHTADNEGARLTWLDQVVEVEAQNPEFAAAHSTFRQRGTPDDLLEQLVAAGAAEEGATRAISGKVIQAAAALVPSMVSGSADLDGSCKTSIKGAAHAAKGAFDARNIHFGIREHGMGAILNGLALHGGYRPIGSTFLVFADYMRPSIRLAAIMKLPVNFVFTHDSLMVGEDGPTHQPVEQVASLRIIPNVHVWRPADGAEVGAAWHASLTRQDGPSALCLTRQGIPALTREGGVDAQAIARGGYVLSDPEGAVATVIATGSEVSTVVDAAAVLASQGKPVRIVSMPCVEVFTSQDQTWQDEVLGSLPVYAVEMGQPDLWCRFTGNRDRVIGFDRFGASAPGKVLAEHFGFTGAKVAQHLAARMSGERLI